MSMNVAVLQDLKKAVEPLVRSIEKQIEQGNF